MRITIKDIAKKMGVAPSTVSRALNKKGRIGKATRRKILRAAQEMDYHPNVNARGLATNRTGNIGIIIDKRHRPLLSSFYDRIILRVEEETGNQGYHLIFATTDGGPSPPRCVQERYVDGLILMGCDISEELILCLQKGIPIVLVDNYLDGVNSIATENIGGGYKAVEHLIELGHREIGFISEPLSDLNFRQRFEGYRLALKEHGLKYDVDLVAEGSTRPDHGYVAMKRLLERGRPSAVFAANDATAVGALRAMTEKELRAPDDIAVVGFDDGEIASHTDPPLTTARIFREKMGALAANRLMELIKNPDQPPVQIRLSTELIIRGSCGGARLR
ncbi:LacI family transcriptional regulator [Candidatus Bipolaricaulota bacterium]|nr:LacI family transcriptional regulator [Candidatus Bipolaricaulota bacterium]